tara:strand:- start:464 stop:1876 length:1413 start_codon:yes stop_codon:yes gene_type:complete
MNTILDTRGYGVPKDHFTPAELNKHRKALSFRPMVTPGYDFVPPKKVIMYRESEKRLWVPKFYGIEHFGKEKTNNERTGKPLQDVNFEGNLKDVQVEILDAVLPKIKESGGGSLCLPTGFGKTVCAIWLACQLKVKTLWVTHKTNLMEQTRERFMSFTDGTVGTIQQSTVDIDHPFVIGMIQSISMKDYDTDVFDEFGLVIFDEAHHVPSHVFSKCLWKINTKYMIGLSATLERKDNLHGIIDIFMGPVLHKVEAQLKIPIVRRVRAVYDEDNEKIEHLNKMGKPDTARLINDLVEDTARNKLIIEETLKAFKEGRTILILSERVVHCRYFKTRIATKLLDESDEVPDIGLYIGGLKSKDLAIANECRIIVATYNMCAEGYDNPNLNTVLFATSKRDVRQSAGRVLGLRSGGGFRPLIIDITDTWGPARNQAAGRLKWYRELNFEIENDKKETTVPVEKWKPTPFDLNDE